MCNNEISENTIVLVVPPGTGQIFQTATSATHSGLIAVLKGD